VTFGPYQDTAGAISLTDGQALTLTGTINNAGQTLTLNTAGAITAGGATISTATLTGSSVGGASFTNASNAIVTFGPYRDTAGAISLTDGQALTMTGAINNAGQTLTLNTAGAITAGGATISTATLTGSSVGGASFTNASNVIGAFGPFTNATSGGISLIDTGSFNLTGSVSASGQSLSLTSLTGGITQTTGVLTANWLTVSAVNGVSLDGTPAAGSTAPIYNQVSQLGAISNTTSGGVSFDNAPSFSLTSAVSAPGQIVSLISGAGAITQTAGVITATRLNAVAVSGLTFNDANAVANLGVLSNSGSGGIGFTDLGGFALTGNVSAPSQTISLVSNSGSISQSGGVLTAGVLTGSASTSVSLNQANAVATLSGFTAASGLSFTNASGFTATGVSGGTFATLKGSSGDMILSGAVSGSTTTLTSTTGAITQTGGVISANSLTGAAGTSASLNDANAVATLSGFSALTGLSFVDAASLTATGVAGGSSTSLTATTGNLTLLGAISGTTTTLTAGAGAINQTGGVITAATLTGGAATSASLNDANAVGALSNFSAVTGLGFTNAAGFSANGVAGGSSTTLTASTGTLTLAGAISGTTTTLTASAGGLNQTGGTITATTLVGSAVSGISLTDANAVANLGALSNSATGGINFSDAGSFNLTDNIIASGQTVTLTSNSGSITQTGGGITANLLNLSAVSGITLNDAPAAPNLVSQLGAVSNSTTGGVSFVDATIALNLVGNISAPGQAVSLTGGSTISQAGGVTLAAGDLTINSVGGLTLGGADTVASDITLTTTGGVNISGSLTGAQTTILATGTFAVGGALNSPNLTLQSGGGAIELGDATKLGSETAAVSFAAPSGSQAPLTLSSASFNNITATTFSLYAGQKATPGAGALGDIQIGNLSWDGNKINTLSLFAGANNAVNIVGRVTPTTAGAGVLVIGDADKTSGWTPGSIYVDGVDGALGAGTANASASNQIPLASVELNAVNDVLLGNQTFVTAIDTAEKNGQVNSINITRGTPVGVAQSGDLDRIFLTSNTLTIRAGGVVAQQNTGLSGQQTGIILTNLKKASTVLTLGNTGGAATPGLLSPKLIDLSLSFFDSSGTLLNSRVAAVSTGIVLNPPLTISSNYRLNGCEVHVSGACTPLPNTVYTLNIAKLIEGVQIANEDVAPTDDPTITGTGNEEIWRSPSCDPNGDKPCP